MYCIKNALIYAIAHVLLRIFSHQQVQSIQKVPSQNKVTADIASAVTLTHCHLSIINCQLVTCLQYPSSVRVLRECIA